MQNFNRDPVLRSYEHRQDIVRKAPNNDYDPTTPFQKRFALNPLALVGVVVALALIGLLFLLH